MAFSDLEKVLIRKYTGYPAYGGIPVPVFGMRYFAAYGDLEFRLTNLSAFEENEIRINFLPKLAQLETDMYNVRDNSDTSQAAVWYRNKQELVERRQNYWQWRRLLCDMLGCAYGPYLLTAYQTRIIA